MISIQLENRYVGIKSRGCYETPGLTCLRAAHMDLEGLVMDREVRYVSLPTTFHRGIPDCISGTSIFFRESGTLKCTKVDLLNLREQ